MENHLLRSIIIAFIFVCGSAGHIFAGIIVVGLRTRVYVRFISPSESIVSISPSSRELIGLLEALPLDDPLILISSSAVEVECIGDRPRNFLIDAT